MFKKLFTIIFFAINFCFSQKIKRIVEETDTFYSKLFNTIIQCLIIFSLISFSIETLPKLSPIISKLLDIFEIIIVLIFTIEYLFRFLVSDNKIKYIFSFYGIIDFLAILPFYITNSIDLRSLRIFRLFRLFRAFKIVRYNKALQNFRSAFLLIKEELILFLIATIFLLYISSVGIYYFENGAQPELFKSVFHCLWWAVATLTTVGYGDIYPITTGGKIFTFLILLIGLGIIAVPTGLIASALTKLIKK